MALGTRRPCSSGPMLGVVASHTSCGTLARSVSGPRPISVAQSPAAGISAMRSVAHSAPSATSRAMPTMSRLRSKRRSRRWKDSARVMAALLKRRDEYEFDS